MYTNKYMYFYKKIIKNALYSKIKRYKISNEKRKKAIICKYEKE